MANEKITKEALARGLKELLKERPFDKISVKDIADRSGMSRNSFYYHFQDKFELISWIFYNDISERVEMYEDSSKFLEESFTCICDCLYQNRAFYKKCMEYVEQNSLFDVLRDLYMTLWVRNLRKRYDELKIDLGDEEIEIMAKMNTRAMLNMIKDWVKKGMKDDYMNYSEKNAMLLNWECFIVDGKYLMLS